MDWPSAFQFDLDYPGHPQGSATLWTATLAPAALQAGPAFGGQHLQQEERENARPAPTPHRF